MSNNLVDPENSEAQTPDVFPWPTGKGHVSFSELSNWMECSYRHKLLYIDKLGKDEASPYLSFGTAVHESCEHYVKNSIIDKELAFKIIRDSWAKDGELFESIGFGKVEK